MAGLCLPLVLPEHWSHPLLKITSPLYVQHEGIAMHNPHLTSFATQKYLNLESFKRDGTPVQTPGLGLLKTGASCMSTPSRMLGRSNGYAVILISVLPPVACAEK